MFASIGALAVVFLAAVGFLVVRQRDFLYYPFRYGPPGYLPADVAPIAKAVRLRASDGAGLEAVWFPPPSETAPVVLQCHGNAGHLLFRLPWAARLARRGLGVLVFDYRGYGASDDLSPTEAGLYRDAEAAFDFLTQTGVAPGRIVVLGESLGGGVASHLAVARGGGGLVLESTFTSAVDRAREAYPFLPVSILLRDRFPTIDRIPRIRAPVLILHGTEDRVIDVSHGKALAAAFGARAELILFPGAGHNDLHEIAGDAYLDRLAAFLNRRADAAIPEEP